MNVAVNSRRVESLTRRAEEWRHHKVLISVARTRHGDGLKAKSDEADAEKGESSGSGTAVPIVVEAPSPCQVADAIDWRNVWNRDYVGATQADAKATTK
jgi:hypothetical protein